MDSNPSLDSDIIPDNNSNGVIYIDSYDDSLKTQFSQSTYMSSCDSLGFPNPIFEESNEYDPTDVISRLANKKKKKNDNLLNNNNNKDDKNINNKNNKDNNNTQDKDPISLKDIDESKSRKRKVPPPLKLEYTITEEDFIIRKKKNK